MSRLWTAEDDKYLSKSFKEGRSIETLAYELERSLSAVVTRLIRHKLLCNEQGRLFRYFGELERDDSGYFITYLEDE